MPGRFKRIARRVGKGVGIAALAAIPIASGFGANKMFTDARFLDSRYVEFKSKSQRANFDSHPLKSLVLSEVAKRNASAPAHVVYFVNPKTLKIESVKFKTSQLEKLETINKLFDPKEVDALNAVISQRVSAIANTALENPKILDLIIKRVGILDVKKYLLSLSSGERARVFSKPEQQEIHRIIESLPEERLLELKTALMRSKVDGDVVSTIFAGALSVLIFKSVRKTRRSS
ncbi:MAG: hypothetical protein Q7S21_05890 [archaeon]|nr:hypothetical protein [archaeon]